MARNLVTPPPLAIFDSQWELEFPRAEHFTTSVKILNQPTIQIGNLFDTSDQDS